MEFGATLLLHAEGRRSGAHTSVLLLLLLLLLPLLLPLLLYSNYSRVLKRTHCPDVTFPAVRLVPANLRGQVVRSADLGFRQLHGTIQHLGNPKVTHFDHRHHHALCNLLVACGVGGMRIARRQSARTSASKHWREGRVS